MEEEDTSALHLEAGLRSQGKEELNRQREQNQKRALYEGQYQPWCGTNEFRTK